MSDFSDFLKKNGVGKTLKSNTTAAGGLFALPAIAGVLQAEGAFGKLKAAIKGVLTLSLPLSVFGVTAFKGMSASIRTILRDTGSLDAALRRLTQIQGLQKMFQPMVGGAEAAKRKVAELVNFAARAKVFDLSSIGEGARALEVMTRGAYSGAKALETVGDSAAASGNSFEAASDAVSGFYDDLRGGKPIDSAAEGLRQMGMITGATADELVSLQQNGATNAQIFEQLTSSLAAAKGGMDALAQSVASANKQYDAAKTALQVNFASPFTESEITNTKNWTAAMTAIAPTVGSVSEFLGKLINGFSTAGSWLAKTAAQSPLLTNSLGLLAKAFTSLIAVVSGLSAIGLASWLVSCGSLVTGLAARLVLMTGATGMAATAITGLSFAVRLLAAVTGIGLIIAALVTAVGVFINFKNSSDEVSKALESQKRAHEEANRAIRDQINAISTLTDKHEALAAAVAASADAYKEYLDSITQKKPPAEIEENRKQVARTDAQREAAAKAPVQPSGTRARQQAERKLRMEELEFEKNMEVLPPTQRIALQKERADQLAKRSEEGFTTERARSNVDKQRSGLDGTIAEKEAAKNQAELLAADSETPPDVAKEQRKQAKNLRGDIAKLRGQQLQMGTASKSPVIQAETGLQQIQAALHEQSLGDAVAEAEKNGDPKEKISELKQNQYTQAQLAGSYKGKSKAELFQARVGLQVVAEQGRANEKNAPQNESQSFQLKAAASEEKRQLDLATARQQIEEKIDSLKSRGFQRSEDEYKLRQKALEAELAAEVARPSSDPNKVSAIIGQQRALDTQQQLAREQNAAGRLGDERQLQIHAAQREGRGGDAINLANLDDFANRLQENLGKGYSQKDAEKLAQRQTGDDIAGRLFNADKNRVVDSLQRIGGGGNVAGDAMQIATQQRDLQKSMAAYLKTIADAATGTGSGGGDINLPFQ